MSVQTTLYFISHVNLPDAGQDRQRLLEILFSDVSTTETIRGTGIWEDDAEQAAQERLLRTPKDHVGLARLLEGRHRNDWLWVTGTGKFDERLAEFASRRRSMLNGWMPFSTTLVIGRQRLRDEDGDVFWSGTLSIGAFGDGSFAPQPVIESLLDDRPLRAFEDLLATFGIPLKRENIVPVTS